MSPNIPALNTLLLPFFGTLLICAIGGMLSPIVVLKQRSYLGDTLAHLIFPGVAFGIFASHTFHLEIWMCMILGAFVTGILGTYLSEWFLKKLKIPPDSSAILCLTAFFAFGMLALFWTKQEEIDPETLLFGDVLNLTSTNFIVLIAVLIFVSYFVFIYRKHWNAWLTDPEFAKIAGFKIKMLDRIFPILITVSVLAGFLAVGGLMISAFITIPAIFCQPRSAVSIPAFLFSVVLGVCGFILAIVLGLPIGPILVLLGFFAVFLKACLGRPFAE